MTMAPRADGRQHPLFAPGSYASPPTGLARLRKLARRAPRQGPPPATRLDQDRDALERLRSMAAELASHFGLRYATLDAEAEGVVEHYGICYADGRIRIRLRHATTGRLLKDSSLVDTLCHELAHLRHFDHSQRFRRFHGRVLEEARRRGWYKPGPVREIRQHALFDPGACGVSRGNR